MMYSPERARLRDAAAIGQVDMTRRAGGWVMGSVCLLVAAASCGNDVPQSRSVESTSSFAPSAEALAHARFVTDRQTSAASDPDLRFTIQDSTAWMRGRTTGADVRVDARGVTLSEQGGAWSIGYELRRIECSDAKIEVARGTRLTSTAPNRVSFARTAGKSRVDEWYVAGPLGVEQGWTLAVSPCASGDFNLVLDVQGADATDSGDSVALRDEAGRMLARTSDAWSTDANGRPMRTAMHASHRQVSITVAAAGATFPLIVDPVTHVEATLSAVDSAGAGFGYAVAIDGDTAAVGAADKGNELGAVYVFVRVGGAWSLQEELTASDAGGFDRFGTSVALEGDTLVVGAQDHSAPSDPDAPHAVDQGAAYVFTRTGTTWLQQQELVGSDGGTNDQFGTSVALDGDVILIGAEYKTKTLSGQGVVYVFTKSGTTWTQAQELVASDAVSSDEFGATVALSGTTALIGAPGKKVGSNAMQGAAYVFTQSGTTWSQQQTLVASDGVANDQLGLSIALSGSTALLGVGARTVGTNANQGVVYVFDRSGTTWTKSTTLVATSGAANDQLGISVGIAGNGAVAGAAGKTVGGVPLGAVYTFLRTGTTWAQQKEIDSTDTSAEDFGISLATDGLHVVTGSGSGTAYVLAGPVDGTTCAAGTDCGSGFCVDGFCCDTACDSTCQACAATLKQSATGNGTCGPATNGSNPHHDACPIDAPSTCGHDGMCDGAGGCRTHPPVGTVCGATCTSGTQSDSACNGTNQCVAGASKSCGNYMCSATACKTTCDTDADCATGFACSGSQCQPVGATCADDATSQSAEGTKASCLPYKCDAKSGSCETACKSVDDCVAPNACDPSGACVAEATGSNGTSSAGSGGDSGGCSLGRSSGSGSGLFFGVVLGVALFRRRRRELA